MKTVEALYKQYGKKFVEVEIIAQDFLGLDKRAARAKALKGDLGGIRTFQVNEKQGAPILVDIIDLSGFQLHSFRLIFK